MHRHALNAAKQFVADMVADGAFTLSWLIPFKKVPRNVFNCNLSNMSVLDDVR